VALSVRGAERFFSQTANQACKDSQSGYIVVRLEPWRLPASELPDEREARSGARKEANARRELGRRALEQKSRRVRQIVSGEVPVEVRPIAAGGKEFALQNFS
jgi:hypothetical protein